MIYSFMNNEFELKISRMKSRRYQHGGKNELWNKCEAIGSIT